jgi:osmotically-inducible protein OsmY
MVKPATDNTALLREHEDKLIEQNINRKLSAVMAWDTSDIQVKTHEGTVLLTGSVADTKSLEQTVLVVFTAKGVRQIENKLTIRKEGPAPALSRATSGIDDFTDDNKGEHKQR